MQNKNVGGQKKVNILIANVGNIRVNEIKALAEALNKKHKITIISQATDVSNRALAFSFSDTPVRVSPLLYKDIIESSSWVGVKDVKSVKSVRGKKLESFDGISAYEFTGNPADAVSITLKDLMKHRPPDLVICGINNGIHMGQDIYCSSNVAMCMEATFLGANAIAVAVERKLGGNTEDDLKNAVEFIEKNVEKFIKMKLPKNTFLNINIPTVKKYTDLKGVKVARMSTLTQLAQFVERLDPLGNTYYWADNVERNNTDSGEEFAKTWFDQKYVTIVPMNYDSTDYDVVQSWDKKIRKEIVANEKEKRGRK